MTNLVLAEVDQIFAGSLCYLESNQLLSKTVVATFWTSITKFGLLFIPTSGHTGPGADKKCFRLSLVAVVQTFVGIKLNLFYIPN